MTRRFWCPAASSPATGQKGFHQAPIGWPGAGRPTGRAGPGPWSAEARGLGYGCVQWAIAQRAREPVLRRGCQIGSVSEPRGVAHPDQAVNDMRASRDSSSVPHRSISDGFGQPTGRLPHPARSPLRRGVQPAQSQVLRGGTPAPSTRAAAARSTARPAPAASSSGCSFGSRRQQCSGGGPRPGIRSASARRRTSGDEVCSYRT